ncbi:Angiopoietin-1 [Chamberlinius hualienensis]
MDIRILIGMWTLCLLRFAFCLVENSTLVHPDAVNNETDSILEFQDLKQQSNDFDRIFHEIQSLTKQMDGLKQAVIRIENTIKEDVTGMMDDLAELRTAVGETEGDLQSTRNSVESIQDWTTRVDDKLRDLDKYMKSCIQHSYPIARSGNYLINRKGKHHNHPKGRKIKPTKMVQIDPDLQADSSGAIVTSEKTYRYASNCCSDIKTEMLKLQRHCSARNYRPSSCADIQLKFGIKKLKNGPHAINPTIYGFDTYFNVHCDFETDGGGWTVFQRRDDFGLPRETFERNWTEYKTGFGDVTKELWLGNDAIYALTNQEPVMLRIELVNHSGQSKYAEYSLIRLGSEKEQYKLHLGKYSGDATDALGRSREMPFSTKDQDNDKWTGNCAQRFRGGWWFNNCHDANLNGFYFGGEHESYADGINWYHWTGFHYSLKRTEMKIRPINFSPQRLLDYE